MEEEGFGKKGSLSSSSSWASRLSPLAQPFTMKRQASQQQPLNSFTGSNPSKPFAPSPSNHLDPFDDTLLSNSFSNLINLEEDQLSVPVSAPTYPSSSSYSAHQSDSSLSASAFPFGGRNPPEFGAETSFSHYPLGSLQGFCDPSSLTDETELDGFSFKNKSSVSAHTQRSAYPGQGGTKDGQNFISLSEARAPAPGSLLKQDSKITPNKISAVADSLPLSTFPKIPQVPTIGSSVTSTTFSPSVRVSSRAADFAGITFASNNHSSYDTNPSGKGDLRDLLKADSREIDQGKGLVDKGKEMKYVKSVSSKGMDPFMIAKSERKVTSDDVYDGLILGKSGLSTENSSKMRDEDEDDLDSPCWKGIQNSGKSPGRVSVSESLHSLQNETEAGPSLNPQAPQFFPSHAKGIMDYSPSNFVVDGFQSFGDSECSSFSVSNRDQRLVDPHKAGPKPPGFGHATGHPHTNGILEPGKESFMLKKSKTGSALSPPQIVKPCLVDRFFPEVNLDGVADRTMDAVHNSPANMSFLAPQIPNFSSSGVGSLNDFSEILQCLSQSLSRCPNINVAMMVKAIRYLSELLVQNCANDYDSLNDHEHEMIQDIIDNLYVLINHRVGQKTPMLGLPHTGSLAYRNKSTAVHEQPSMEFQVTRSKDLVVRRDLESQGANNRGNGYSHVPIRNMKDLVSSSRDVGSERGIVPVALKENRWSDEELHPQALLNLWVEAQAALCSMKYENNILRMKLQMDGCRAEQV